MLRRKFLIVHGSLVTLLMGAAMAAILLLHGVLRDVDAVGTAAVERATIVLALGADLASLEAELLHSEANGPPAATARSRLGERLANLRGLRVTGIDPETEAAFRGMERIAAEIAQSDAAAKPPVGALAAFRTELRQFEQFSTLAVQAERKRALGRFRGVALTLGAIFLVVINVSVMVLSRMMTIVMRPVDRLVEASRQLAKEDFSYRLDLEGMDPESEFGELSRAYNALAEQLQANEQRKLEMLRHVSRALSHEINNAIAIVDMQLALVVRAVGVGGGAPPLQAERLRQIHETLGRISRTAEALTRVRRIVLTDYTAGVPMLDLERSVEAEPGPEPEIVTTGGTPG